MRLGKTEGEGWSFTDLMFGLMICVFTAIPLLMLLINPKAIPDVNVKKEANYIIEMTWPEDIDCDVDMWVKDPTGRLVSFQNKSDGLMSIERDDMGTSTDSIWHNGQLHKNMENREIWTLRGVLDGNYIVNGHIYNCRGKSVAGGYSYAKPGMPVNIPVRIKVIRVNPRYLVQLEREIVFDKIWQEKTMAKFELFDNGFRLVDKGTDFVGLVTLSRGMTLQ